MPDREHNGSSIPTPVVVEGSTVAPPDPWPSLTYGGAHGC